MIDSHQDIYATQPGWKWCRWCQGLWLASNGTKGKCYATPSNDGTHDGTGSGSYTLALAPSGIISPQPGPSSGNILQPLWNRCNKCQLLFFTGNGGVQSGVCPAGEKHDGTGSGNYCLLQNSTSYPKLPGHQYGWYWCQYCQGLSYLLNNTTDTCKGDPSAWHAHSGVGSGNYALPKEYTPSYGA